MNTTAEKIDEISLKKILISIKFWLNFLISKWVIIILFGAFGGLIGFINSYNKKPIYTSVCTFVLEGGSNGSQGTGIQGLASIQGMTSSMGMGGLQGSGGGILTIFQSNNYNALYKSRKILLRTMLSNDSFNSKKMKLIDYYIDFNKYRESSETKTLFENINFSINEEKYTSRHNQIINFILSDIKEIFTVQNAEVGAPVLSIKVKSEDSLFSKIFSEKIIESVNQFYIETKSQKIKENYQIIESRVDSLKRELYNAMSGVAIAQENIPNINSALQIIKLRPQQKQIEVSFLQSMYTSAANELEIARNEIRKIHPFILIIDRPTFPLQVTEGNPLFGMLIGLVVALILSILGLVMYTIVKKMLV